MKYALTKNLLENLAELLGEEHPKVMALKSEYRMKQNSMTREKNYSILCCKKVDMSLLWDTRHYVKIHLYGNTLKCTRSSGSGVEHG